MEESETTFDLELYEEIGRKGSRPVARVVVARAEGFTRDGGSPTVTRACASARDFVREVERLEAELARLRERGRRALEGEPQEPTPAPAPAPDVPRAAKLVPGLLVRDVMTREVRTLQRNDPISLADELMKVGRFRHVVVLEDDGGVAGVVSQRDIFHGALAFALGLGKRAHESALASNPIKNVMQTGVVDVAPEDPLEEAARRMRDHKVGCLPVLDDHGLVGILTEGDLLSLLAEMHSGAQESPLR